MSDANIRVLLVNKVVIIIIMEMMLENDITL